MMSIHKGPHDRDDLLFVPEEFERAHSQQARREVRQTYRRGRVWRRLDRWSSPRSRAGQVRRALIVLHALGALVGVAFAAITSTWVVGGVICLLVGASLLIGLRTVTMIAAWWADDRATEALRAQQRISWDEWW